MPRKAKSAPQPERIVVAEPLGYEGLEVLRSGLLEVLESGVGEVVVDMTEASGIDGACLSVLLKAAQELPAERRLSVLASPGIARSFAEWRVDTVIGVVEDSSTSPVDSPGKE